METFLILQNITMSETGHEGLLLDISGKYHIQHVDITKKQHTK